jgi:hypothetical protein
MCTTVGEGQRLMLTSHFSSLFWRHGELTKRFTVTIITPHSSHKAAEITGRPQTLFLNSRLRRPKAEFHNARSSTHFTSYHIMKDFMSWGFTKRGCDVSN